MSLQNGEIMVTELLTLRILNHFISREIKIRTTKNTQQLLDQIKNLENQIRNVIEQS